MSPGNPAKDAGCLVGFGKAIISPPRGVALAGYFTPRPNRGVLDDLQARAWLVRSGHSVTGVINLDLLCVTSELDARVRQALESDGFPYSSAPPIPTRVRPWETPSATRAAPTSWTTSSRRARWRSGAPARTSILPQSMREACGATRSPSTDATG